MNRIAFPLTPQMKRATIGDLHSALGLLGYTIPDVEQSIQRFGAATRDAVRKLQADHGLAVTGVVDEATAALLNRLLADRDALDAEITYTVRGVVRAADGIPAPGLTVQAFDRDVAQATMLGADVTGEDGAYLIRFGEAQFKGSSAERGGPEVFIRVFDGGGQQLGQSKTIKDSPPKLSLDLTLLEAPITKFVVHGQVTTAENQPARDVLVKVFDRNVVIDDTVLGQADIDAQGRYVVSYVRDQLQGKPTADLVVAAYAKGEETLLQTSDVILNAAPDVLHDFKLPAYPPPAASQAAEFETLSARIAALPRVPSRLGELKDKDITFLSKKAKIDVVKLRRLAQSDRLANGDAALARFYYALLADGQATEPEVILGRDRASIVRLVEGATAAHLIPEICTTDLDRILDVELPKQRGKKLLERAPAGRPASLGDLLDTLPEPSKLDNEQQLAFAIRYGQHGNTPALWEAPQADTYNTKIPDLQRTLALAEITQGHGALVKALQQAHDLKEPGSVTYLAKLARRDWLELALTHGAPPESAQSAVEYGFELERIVERRCPMVALRERLASGEIKIRNFPAEAVVTVLAEHPDFDPATERADTFLERVGARTDELSKALRGVQRLLPLTGALRTTAALLNAGLDSALAVSRAGRDAVADYLSDEVDRAEAQAIYNRSYDVTMTNTALVTRYSPLYNRHATPAIPHSKTSAAFLDKYPNLRALFGDLDYCACQHCQSVLGPAAYLTDLMHFLETTGRKIKSTDPTFPRSSFAFLGLLARRPDLASLLLTCDNTNIEIPYIDLVLEVLENTIALPAIETVATDRSAEIIAALDRNEVPKEIRDALRKTAITIGDVLDVSPLDVSMWWNLLSLMFAIGAGGSSGTLMSAIMSKLPAKLVRLDDGARRWIAGYVPKLMWTSTEASFEVDSVDVDAVEKDLKQGLAPAELLQVYEKLLELPVTASVSPLELPQGTLPFSVACEFTLSVGVDLVLPKLYVSGLKIMVTLLKPDGEALRSVQVTKSSREMIAKWLKGELSGGIWQRAVMSLLQLPALPWNVTWDEASHRWQLRHQIGTTPLYISEAMLFVFSLTYRCSSIQTDLAAIPENHNPLAYNVLREAVFPWTLPLDLWTEEVRVYLQELGVPRQRLMEISGVPLNSLAYSCEALGLSIADSDVIGKYKQAPWEGWGLLSSNWLEALKSVAIILRQSGLSFRELLDIRQTGPDALAWPPITPAGECHPDKMSWGVPDQDPDQGYAAQLAWIHAFTHLWRKTGWTMRELSQVVRAMLSDENSLDSQELLRSLALVARLRSELNQPILHVAAMLGHIELTPWVDHLTEGEPVSASLYERLFQSAALRPSASFAYFAVDPQANELSYLSAVFSPGVQTLSAHAPFLAAALGVASLDVEHLVEFLTDHLIGPTTSGLNLFSDELRLVNLATLVGVAACCRSLHLGADDFIRWTRHLDNPFKSAVPIKRAAELLAFAEGVSFARGCGTSLDELDYLLRHDLQGAFVDTKARLRTGLAGLRDALRKGALLSNVTPENLCIQLAKLNANEKLLAAIRDEVGVAAVLKAEVVIEPPPSGALPELPADLATRFDYCRGQDGIVRLGCRGIVSDADFDELPQNLEQKSVNKLKTRYQLVRDVLVSQLLFLCKSADTVALPSFPTLIAGAAINAPEPAIPMWLQAFLSVDAGQLRLAALITQDQGKQLKEVLPELAAQVEDLVQKSEDIRTSSSSSAFLEATMACGLVGGKTDGLLAVMQRLVPVLETGLLISQVAGLLGIEAAMVGRLLNIVRLDKAADSRTALALLTDTELLGSQSTELIEGGRFENQIRVLLKLDKAARLIGSLRFTSAQLDWIAEDAFKVLRMNHLPSSKESPAPIEDWRSLAEDWRSLQQLGRFRDSVAGGADTVKALADCLREKKVTLESVVSLFAEAYGLDPAQISKVANRLGIHDQEDQEQLRQPAMLMRWIELLHLLKLLGTTVETVEQLVSASPTDADAMAARKLFMAQFDAETLPKRLQPVSDKLRVRQRDALVSYLMNRDGLPDENALLDYYLIDAKMEPCMRTSRIKQAISSVQLYIQRCLLNLESHAPIRVAPKDIDTTLWRWMKNYRVWEANRKVFLYPENWIEPDLRDDKTEIFRAFESDVQQDDLDGEMALDAFRGYLERAVGIARLRVMAVWRDGNVVQILAQDSAAQAKYYHRQLTFAGSTLAWTPWESIEGNFDSEHVFIFKLAGFLHIAYAEIRADGHRWKVGFAVRRRTKQGWSEPYKSGEQDALRLPMIPNKNEAQTFVFRLFRPRSEQDRVGSRSEQDRECIDILAHALKPEDDYILTPREGQLNITRPYVSGEAQRLHTSIRVLEKFTDQYGHEVYARPSARNWTATIRVLIKFKFALVEYTLSAEGKDEICISDSGDLLLNWSQVPNNWELILSVEGKDITSISKPDEVMKNIQSIDASKLKVSKVIIRAFGDHGAHEEHALSVELDTEEMGWGAIERDIVFTVRKDFNYPVLAPDRQVSFEAVARKFVVNDDLSITFGVNDRWPTDSLPEPLPKNAERYRSGFRQIKTQDEATAELNMAKAVEKAAAEAKTNAEQAAENENGNAAREVGAKQADLNVAKKEKEEVENKIRDAKSSADKAYNLVTVEVPDPADPFNKTIREPNPFLFPASSVIAVQAKIVSETAQAILNAGDSVDIGKLQEAKKIAEDARDILALLSPLAPGLSEIAAAVEMLLEVAITFAEKCRKVKEAEETLKGAKAKEKTISEINSAKIAEATRLLELATEERKRKEAALTATKDTSVDGYLTRSSGKYFKPSTQPDPVTWSDSDAYSDDRFQLYFLKHEGTHRVLADGQAWLFAGLRQLPSPIEPGNNVPLLPKEYQTLSSASDSLSIPLGPLGKDSPKDLRVSFSSEQPSSIYDWEAVFHAPLLIATQLSAAQRFEDAQRWFHTIFDPTTNDPEPDESKRYWRFPPFREAGQGEGIDQWLEKLAQNKPVTDEDQKKLDAFRAEIAAWKKEPFNPHLVARYRIRAYQWTVVIKYVQNLIAWGDQLFRRDTIEAINEATQIYILAARILGRRAASIPRCQARTRSYLELAYGNGISNDLDDFSNAWVALEDFMLPAADLTQLNQIPLPFSLYFCVPHNSAIENLWDTVENRLFNIRHCRNIEGVERKLPLFEPPIDPALLVKAAAAGLDISAVLTDLGAPLPLHRFSAMLPKALEVCADVRALGAAVLQALEKKDAEDLALLRNSHEIALLKLTEQVKQRQIDEATLTMQGLEESRRTAEIRYDFYQRLLGRADVSAPKKDEVAALAPTLTALAKSGPEGVPQGLGISQKEVGQLQLLRAAQLTAFASGVSSTTAGVLLAIGGILSALPRGSSPGPQLGDMGGPLTGAGHAANAGAGYLNTLSGLATSQAGMEGIVAGYERRRDDWIFQSNMALREMAQIDKQWAAAEIRKQIAEQELESTREQIDNARSIDEFMKSKYSSAELYRYMSNALVSLYFRTYQLALDVARRAQRCFQFELAQPNISFIEPGYWDSTRKGLLSGEQLHLDLRRMELAYMESLKRDYEITKHVSLMQIDPLALIALRQNGRCEFTIPEALYDLDCPGHYIRRIKSVSITIPCLTGPYAGVHCTLTLLSSSVRKDAGGTNYQKSIDDPRFKEDYSSIQSIVTSGAQADTGLFETNLRDERYLPFEGAGAISTWRLELPSEIRQFDYDTISDVILHVRYTAREGGAVLRGAAMKALHATLKEATDSRLPQVRLFSLKHEFPAVWARFLSQTPSGAERYALTPDFGLEHYPFWSQAYIDSKDSKVIRLDVLAQYSGDSTPTSLDLFGSEKPSGKTPDESKIGSLHQDSSRGNLLVGKLDGGLPKQPVAALKLYFNTNTFSNIWLAVTWSS